MTGIKAKMSMTRGLHNLGGDYGVARNSELLRRYAFMEERLMKWLAAWLICIPEWEIKLKLARHLYEDAEHASLLRKRIGELRGARADGMAEPRLTEVMEESLNGANTVEFLMSVYGVLKRQLLQQYKRHMSLTDPHLDAPTVRMLEWIVLEEERQLQWLQDTLGSLDISPEVEAAAGKWHDYIEALLAKAGGVSGEEQWDGTEPIRPSDHRFVLPLHAQREEQYERCNKRNDPPAQTDDYLLLWQFRHHRDEMQATEIFASVLYETSDMPWEFLYDVARHVWDESRHCQMGQRRLQELGVEMTDFPVMTGNIEFQLRHLDPLERYALTTLEDERVEMPNKRIKYDRAQRLQDPVSALCTDYDWSDEINHVRFGKKWVPQMLWARQDMRSTDELLQQCIEKAKKYFRSQPVDWPRS